MTKKKPGAVRGRPKGSGAGFDVLVSARVPPEVAAEIDKRAAELEADRSAAIREILGAWAKRRAKR